MAPVVAPPQHARRRLSTDGAAWDDNPPTMPEFGPSGLAASRLEIIVALSFHHEQLSTALREEQTSPNGYDRRGHFSFRRTGKMSTGTMRTRLYEAATKFVC